MNIRVKQAYRWMKEHKKLVMLVMLALTLLVTSCRSAMAAEKVEEVTGGGLKAWLIRDASLPMVTLEMTFRRSGALSDPVGKEGLAAFTAEVLTEGAGDHPSATFHELLEQDAIHLSVGSSNDDLVITMECLSEHLGQALALLGEMLRSPRFDQVDIDRERLTYLTTLRQLQESPSYRLSEAFDAAAFAGHPYAHPAYGTASSVSALQRTDLQSFAHTALTKDRVILSISGDADAITLSHLMEKEFSTLPAKADKALPASERVALHTQPAPVKVAMDVPQTEVRVALPGIKRNDPEFYAAFVMNYLVGGGSLTSRLAEEVRKKRGLTYSIQSSLAMQEDAEWLSIDFATKKESAGEALKATLQTLQAIAEKGFSAEELKAALAFLTGSFALSTDSNAERVHYLTVMQQYGLGPDYLEKRNRLIANVTLPQVTAIAKRLLNPHQRLVVLTGTNP